MSRSRRRSRAVATQPRVATPVPVVDPERPAPEVAAGATRVAPAASTLPILSDRALLVIVVGAATLLRLAVAPWGRYLTDSQVLAFRAERLARLPINQLYNTDQGIISHLPGDLWFLWYVSNVYRVLAPDGNFYGDSFLYVAKLVPICADAGVALALFLIARDLAGPRAGVLAAALYAFTPGPFVIAAIWNQWDAISACFALLAVWLFLRRHYELAAAAVTYAALVKPQFAMFGALFAVAYARQWFLPPLLLMLQERRADWPTAKPLVRPLARAAGAVVVAWITASAVLLPFNVSIPPLSAQFDLRDRLNYVFRVHDETTLNAFNLWATPIAGNAINDFEVSFAGLTSRTWGQLLLGAAVLLIFALWWGRGTDRALIWACLALTFASFMLPTRIHERYLLPTVALAALVAAIQPRLLWFWAALSFTFAANVIAVYWMAHDQLGAPFFSENNPWMTILAFANLALFAWFLVRGLPELESKARVRLRRPAHRRGLLARAPW
jgi:Gpi18-like mannosyltransferase